MGEIALWGCTRLGLVCSEDLLHKAGLRSSRGLAFESRLQKTVVCVEVRLLNWCNFCVCIYTMERMKINLCKQSLIVNSFHRSLCDLLRMWMDSSDPGWKTWKMSRWHLDLCGQCNGWGEKAQASFASSTHGIYCRLLIDYLLSLSSGVNVPCLGNKNSLESQLPQVKLCSFPDRSLLSISIQTHSIYFG